MCLQPAPTKVSPNLGKKKLKSATFPKKRACDTPATLCDVLRRPATFFATPATFSATPCDVLCDALRRFLAVFGRFCNFWPCLYHILENKGNVPKFHVSWLVSPRFVENLDKERKSMSKIVLPKGLAESN